MSRGGGDHRERALRCRLLGVVVLATGLTVADAAEDLPWAFPVSLSGSPLAAVVGRDATLLDLWFDADLRYDGKRDGIVGTVAQGYDVWLRDAGTLERMARVVKRESPLIRHTALDIEVLPAGGGKARRIRDDDLVWRGQTESDAGVVTLDAQVYVAVLPGLRIGDRLRVVARHEWRGTHGMPVLDLRDDGEAWARVAARVKAPSTQDLSFQVTGPDSLRRAVTVEIRTAGTTTVGLWELRDRRSDDWSVADSADGDLMLVTHVTSSGETRAPDAFVGAATWAEAAAGYRARIEPLLAATPPVQELAQDIVADLTQRPAQIAALYRHVQNTTRYLGLFRGEDGIIPASADDTRRLGYGDCKGLSIYLAALCRAVGIDAWPVLVRTARLGSLAAEVPNLAQFDHVIVWADDGQDGCWLDPTLEGIPAGTLVPADVASPALLLRPGTDGLTEIPLAAWRAGCRTFEVVGAVDESLRLQATITLTHDGPGGRILAGNLARLNATDRDTAVRELLLSSGLTVEQILAPSPALPPWCLEARARQPLASAGGRAFLPAELPPLNLAHAGPSARPGTCDLRGLPDRVETWSLTIPQGWRLAAPDSFAVAGPGVTWRRTVHQDDRILQLRREIRWTEAVVDAGLSALLLQALDDAAARERIPLVLRKETR